MTGLEYIQRQINLVKQQIKGSKVKIIVTDIDPVTKFKKLQYDLYENELQTLESIEKSLKALEIIKKKNVWVARLKGLFKKYNNDLDVLRIYNANMPSIDYQLTEEEFNLLKEVLE